jgi:acylphosphatase
LVHKDIIVSGRVQGVGFRYSARKVAIAYGIKGYVKNMNDGNVYIEAEGPEYNIIEFINWCTKGPSNARVEDVSVSDGDIKGYNHFDVKH